MNEFASDQSARMRSVLGHDGTRSSLVNSNGLTVVTSPENDFTASSPSYIEIITFFTDTSSNDPTSWSWPFPVGNPSSSTFQNLSVCYSAGTYTVYLTASNSFGTENVKTLSIKVVDSPAPVCTTITNQLPDDFDIGITNVIFNTINNTTEDAFTDGAYVDYACSKSTELTAGQSDTLSVTVGGYNVENIQAFIDFNNNGSFVDSGEKIFTSKNVIGTVNTTIQTPSDPVIGRMLRMRVISDFLPLCKGPCATYRIWSSGRLQYFLQLLLLVVLPRWLIISRTFFPPISAFPLTLNIHQSARLSVSS
jgi:PKD repeat protein